jgi:autotransporter adhesin
MAIGVSASAANNGTAVGGLSVASAFGATAVGRQASAGGNGATGVGNLANASGVAATAVGALSLASASGATALGQSAAASGVQATAVGYNAQATQFSSTAIGYGAQAAQGGSTAIGKNATATKANQVALGGTGSSIKIGDIAASTAAQVGPVNVVTVDANGTLGRQSVVSTAQLDSVRVSMIGALAVSDAQFGALSNRVDGLEFELGQVDHRTSAGIAAAMALGGTTIVPDSNLSVSFNAAAFRGEQGYSGSIVARVAPKIYVSGGIAGSSQKKSTGARVGVAFGL